MRSIVQTDGTYCFLCRRAIGTEEHHIFGGPNRKNSEADGLKVRLCRECHDAVHNDPARSGNLQKALHELGQMVWESHYGAGLELCGEDPRKEFVKRYGRNYL